MNSQQWAFDESLNFLLWSESQMYCKVFSYLSHRHVFVAAFGASFLAGLYSSKPESSTNKTIGMVSPPAASIVPSDTVNKEKNSSFGLRLIFIL